MPPHPRARRAGRGKLLWVRIDPTLAVRVQLRQARAATKLSQADLAKRVRVSRQQISQLESPDANLKIKTFERMARALRLELDIALVPEGQHAVT